MENTVHGWTIPRWLMWLLGAMYRFVVGGFGISVPRPWRTTLCKPFWIVVAGIIGLPIVLMGYLLRGVWIVLGKTRVTEFVEEFVEDHDELLATIVKWLAVIFYGGAGGFLLGFGIWSLISWLGWFWALVVIFAIIGAITTLVAIGVGAYKLNQWLADRRPAKTVPAEPAKINPVVRGLKKSGTIAIAPARGIWQIFALFGYMIYALYKRFCPIVEFP